jgi:hypothetical protein
MSAIDRLKSKISGLETKSLMDAFVPKSSGWLSRKMVVMLAVIGVLVLIGRENQALIMQYSCIMAGIWLLTQVIQDVAHSRDSRKVRIAMIEAMAKDGLSDEERKELGEKPGSPS